MNRISLKEEKVQTLKWFRDILNTAAHAHTSSLKEAGVAFCSSIYDMFQASPAARDELNKNV